LYQENKELRRELEERTIETSTSQSQAGNENCLKIQLREAQDMIIQPWQEQRVSEEIIAENFKECRSAMDNARLALTSAQAKMKGDAVLWRQVKNMNKHN
jgi:hypothetical protein